MIITTSVDFLNQNSICREIKWENIPPFIPTSTMDEILKFICMFGGVSKTIFEFGTWIGRSTKGFSQNFKEVVSIDFIESSDINYGYLGFASGELAKGIDNVTLVNYDSMHYDYSNYINKFDVIYVDGNHSYEGATSDITNSFKLLKDSGFIFIDDFINPTFGVASAVNNYNFTKKYFIEDISLVCFVKESA